MTRLKDIAQRAGLSIMTVSKALHDAPDISAKTKVRLRLLAKQMDYVPDSVALGLRTRKTRLLGLVISAITNPLFVRLLMALEHRAFQLGYALIITHSLNEPEREEAVIRRLLIQHVDGLLISPVYRLAEEAPIYKELRRRGTPTVILGPLAPFCRDFINVEVDEFQAGYLATQHLLGLGHKRIVFLAGPAAAPWAHSRIEGYRRALREAKLPVDDHLIFNAGGTIEEGAKAALQMLAEAPVATAIQAVNDLVAIGAGNALLNRHHRIPQDLSLIGCGNFLTSEYFRVPLTTLRQPKSRLGEAAMNALCLLLRGERPAPKRLPCELVVRASTAAPRAL